MKTALIVEDLPDSRTWLAGVLVAAFPGVAVESADSVAHALASLDRSAPDIALVDLGLPDGSGIDVIRQITKRSSATVTVVTTVFADDQHVFPALRAGAHGYVLKDQTADELVPLLQGIVNGRPPLSPAIARRLLGFFGPAGEKSATTLTARETEVLTLIAKGLTIAKVAETLGISHNTAAGYVKGIYRKLNVSSRAEATMEAARLGVITTITE